MDAAQIIMMPTAVTPIATTLLPLAGTAQTSGELSALFSDLLAQTVVTQTAVHQIPDLDTVEDLPDSSVLASKVVPEQDQVFVALLEQIETPETESSTTLQTAAAYAQLAVVQTPLLPPSPLEQELSVVLATDTSVEELSAAVDVVTGSGQSAVPELPELPEAQQGSTPLRTATNDVLPRQLQEQELSGQVGVMQQKHFKTIEMTDKHEDKVTQAENRTQPLEQVVVENQVRTQEVPATVRLTESQQQPLVPPTGDNRIYEQQPQQQQPGNSRGQEQHQQAAVQVQVIRPDGAQDNTITNKSSATAQVQAFRFAQASEVAVVVADTSRQGRDFSGQQQSQTFQQPTMPILEITEEAPVVSTVPVQHAQAATELHQMTFLSGSRPQAVPAAMVADELPKQVQGEQVARQVFERLGTHEFRQGSDQISLRLSPEHLGNVQLNLRMEEQGLKLEIITEQRGVREALLRQGDELKETLARQNIRIDSFDVSTGNLGGQSQQQREWRQMNAEQRMYHAQHTSAARGGSVVQDSLQGVQYFAPQYQSTIDVRF